MAPSPLRDTLLPDAGRCPFRACPLHPGCSAALLWGRPVRYFPSTPGRSEKAVQALTSARGHEMQEVTARLPFVPFVINMFFLLFLKRPFSGGTY